MVPESQNTEAPSFQPCGPLCIRGNFFGVVPPIEFDDQLLLKADEIYNIAAQRLLSSKLTSFQ